MLLDAAIFGRRSTDSATAFLHGLTQNHGCSRTVFLVDIFKYLASVSRLKLKNRLDYIDRNHVEK